MTDTNTMALTDAVLAVAQILAPQRFRHGLAPLQGDGPNMRAEMAKITAMAEKCVAAVKAQPVALPAGIYPVASKSHGAWDGIEDVLDMPDGTEIFTAAQVQAMLDAAPQPAAQALDAPTDTERLDFLAGKAALVKYDSGWKASLDVSVNAMAQHGYINDLRAAIDAAIAAQQGGAMAETFKVKVIKADTGEVVKTLEAVTERAAERAERGLNINMNHADYYTVIEPPKATP